MVIIVRFLRRFHTQGQAIPHVHTIQVISPSVQAGFDTALPTFRTSNGLSRPTSYLLNRAGVKGTL